jgi:hypothetical protein
MSARSKRAKVAPDGWHLGRTIHGHVRVPSYPADTERAGKALRDLRVERGYGLRETAMLLGMTALELSELERGAARFEDHEAAMAEAAELLPRRGP